MAGAHAPSKISVQLRERSRDKPVSERTSVEREREKGRLVDPFFPFALPYDLAALCDSLSREEKKRRKSQEVGNCSLQRAATLRAHCERAQKSRPVPAARAHEIMTLLWIPRDPQFTPPTDYRIMLFRNATQRPKHVKCE